MSGETTTFPLTTTPQGPTTTLTEFVIYYGKTEVRQTVVGLMLCSIGLGIVLGFVLIVGLMKNGNGCPIHSMIFMCIILDFLTVSVWGSDLYWAFNRSTTMSLYRITDVFSDTCTAFAYLRQILHTMTTGACFFTLVMQYSRFCHTRKFERNFESSVGLKLMAVVIGLILMAGATTLPMTLSMIQPDGDLDSYPVFDIIAWRCEPHPLRTNSAVAYGIVWAASLLCGIVCYVHIRHRANTLRLRAIAALNDVKLGAAGGGRRDCGMNDLQRLRFENERLAANLKLNTVVIVVWSMQELFMLFKVWYPLVVPYKYEWHTPARMPFSAFFPKDEVIDGEWTTAKPPLKTLMTLEPMTEEAKNVTMMMAEATRVMYALSTLAFAAKPFLVLVFYGREVMKGTFLSAVFGTDQKVGAFDLDDTEMAKLKENEMRKAEEKKNKKKHKNKAKRIQIE